ncbi:acyltransferase [Pseudomonas sp. 43A]|uniref:acyltransferase family protein n=1 Tax=unclassified Pseudomonas TaxID=196821 RepID=UPI0015875EA8|nr:MULTISPECIES: acyltransferase [unclassified Pseudomonas]QKV66464.1 acyltransferase [Pseudomonas sp. 43A]QMW11083.1 acyltransferase [Pseudomonas sp. 29A]
MRTEIQKKQRGRLEGIESLRAYAAVTIILFHLVGSGGAKLPSALSFIGSHFGFGVQLFFVVSGFSLAYGYWGKLSSELAIGHYFARRFARIAPLFYAALIFQLFYLWLCWDVTYSPTSVIVNILFAFNVIPGLTDGIVGASWTIGVEMIFYALFPLLLMLCKTTLRSALVLVFSILLSSLFSVNFKPFEEQLSSFIHHNFLSFLPFFLWGVLGFHIHRKISHMPLAASRYVCWTLCGAAIILMICLYNNIQFIMFFMVRDLRATWDMLWGIPFVFLCIAMALHPSRFISNPLTRYLGKISFSLYLVHPTIVYGLGYLGFYNWVYEFFPTSLAAGFVSSLIISMVIITLISALTFRYIEQPGMDWGKRLTLQKTPIAATA